MGGNNYNQKLSERRALTVKHYLQSKGIDNVIEVKARGEDDQIGTCGALSKATKALVDCLQANRRVMIEITGVKKH